MLNPKTHGFDLVFRVFGSSDMSRRAYDRRAKRERKLSIRPTSEGGDLGSLTPLSMFIFLLCTLFQKKKEWKVAKLYVFNPSKITFVHFFAQKWVWWTFYFSALKQPHYWGVLSWVILGNGRMLCFCEDMKLSRKRSFFKSPKKSTKSVFLIFLPKFFPFEPQTFTSPQSLLKGIPNWSLGHSLLFVWKNSHFSFQNS